MQEKVDPDFALLSAVQLPVNPRVLMQRKASMRHPGSRRGRRRDGRGYLSSPVGRVRHVTTDYGISVPRLKLHGEFNLGDMLNQSSLANLFTVYSQLTAGRG